MSVRSSASVVVLSVLLAAGGAGCIPQPGPTPVAFERGVQMLAAGSPKSAIPFFAQLIVSQPDGPEPHAMLAMAYALNLQPDLAIEQAKLVERDYRDRGVPGWECVALGIAAMTQRRDDDAVMHLRHSLDWNPSADEGVGAAARQWLTLALLVKGDRASALSRLDQARAAGRPVPVRQTALLWSVLILGYQQEAGPAGRDLAELARLALGGRTAAPDQAPDADGADSPDIGESAILAVSRGQLLAAERRFAMLHQRAPNASDAGVWLGLLNAAQGRWDAARTALKNSSQEGPNASRALASQLLSVVCALEGRPDLLIQHMLAGQRLQAHHRFPMQTPRRAQPDLVWGSDRLK